MRDFLRGCRMWLVGYPLSALAASAVLSAITWTAPGIETVTVIDSILAATPVVAFFSLVPATLTPASSRVWDFVAAGARTGGGFGLLVISPYLLVFIASLAGVAHSGLGGRPIAIGDYAEIAWFVFLMAALLSLFTVAGAAGGLVFGVFAVERRGE